MRKFKEQSYKDMHPFILDLESQDYGVLSHSSAGNRLGVRIKIDQTDNLVKHAKVRAETKWGEDVSKESTIDPQLPELVTFLQETSASCERHPSLGKCGVRGCELDHNAISCIFDLDVDSRSEVTRHALWTETSASYVVTFKAKQVLPKDQIEMRSPDRVVMEKKVDVHVKDEIPVKRNSPEMPTIHGDSPGETSAMPISAGSYRAAAVKHNVPPHINQRKECPGRSEIANGFEVESKLMLGSMMSETGTLVKKQVCGDTYFSEASPITTPHTESDTVPYFRSISLRSKSNSSTTSSKSFSFPLLPFEWNGSPIKMAEADRTNSQGQQNRPWWTRFVCCKQEYISQCDSDDEIAHKIMK